MCTLSKTQLQLLNSVFITGKQFLTVTPYKEHTYDQARGGVYSLRYSEGSRWIAAGYQDGSIEVFT